MDTVITPDTNVTIAEPMNIEVKRELNGYGEKYLLNKFKEMEKDHRFDNERIENHKKKRQDCIEQVECNERKIDELTSISKNVKRPSVKHFLTEEQNRLKSENNELSERVKHLDSIIKSIDWCQIEFNHLQEELTNFGILAENS